MRDYKKLSLTLAILSGCLSASAQEISLTQDNNAGEVIRRVPGVGGHWRTAPIQVLQCLLLHCLSKMSCYKISCSVGWMWMTASRSSMVAFLFISAATSCTMSAAWAPRA